MSEPRNIFDVDPKAKMRSEGPTEPAKAAYVDAVAKVREKLATKDKEVIVSPWCFHGSEERMTWHIPGETTALMRKGVWKPEWSPDGQTLTFTFVCE